MVLFCNLVGAYERKIREDKFGGCRKSFSWLGQKVNRKIDTYSRDAKNSRMEMPQNDVASQQDITTTSSILVEFEATEYSYSIRYSFRIRNVKDIRFD